MLIKLVTRRVAAAIPTLFALTLAVFLMVKAVPGDPAMILLGERASSDDIAKLQHELGLDQPLLTQYFRYLERLVVHGDFGKSLVNSDPVLDTIQQKFPATIELAVSAMVFATLLGVPIGIVAATRPGSLLDFSTMSLATIGVSMPIFWLALVLTWVFGLELGWFPISGRISIDFYYEPVTGFILIDALLAHDWSMWRDAVWHLVLPAVALGSIPMAFLARMTRASLLDVLTQDYVRTAQAKGLGRIMIYFKHALKNAFIPILTVLGLQFGLLLGGAIITETIFSWPGIGKWLLESVNARDYAALEGGILVVASTFVLINMIVDLLYRSLDPRIRVN